MIGTFFSFDFRHWCLILASIEKVAGLILFLSFVIIDEAIDQTGSQLAT